MKKLLIGMIIDGKAGGVDKYILDFYNDIHGKYAQVDFLSGVYSEELAEELKKHGSQLLVCPKMSDLAGQYRALKQIVSYNKYDIVYFNYSTAIGWTAVKGARDAGAERVIVHSHNSGFSNNSIVTEKLFELAHYLFRPLLCRYATDYLSCSDKAAVWMFGKIAKNGKRVRLIKNEVDDTRYYPDQEKRDFFRSQYGLEDSFVIGNVGGMLKAKNQAFLIKLLVPLKAVVPNAKLLLVGDGENRKSLEALTSKLGLDNDVIFAGYMNTENGIMNAFDVFCLPSYIEGFPYVAVEAQKLNLPCILSDRITKQVRRLDQCTYKSLNKPKEWINQIDELSRKGRKEIRQIENKSLPLFITRVEFFKEITDI